MRRDALTARGAASALLLVLAGAALAWLCFRAAIVRVLPATAPLVERLAPNDPRVVLTRANLLLARPDSPIGAATLDRVRGAALAAPLDARPFLLLGRQQLLDDQMERATKTFEAGQRLDPRNRFIHLFLLERYLRAGRFNDAAAQFATLARLVGQAQPAVATVMGQMAMAPDMRDAVRRTLATDPRLEQAVLVALARSNTDPAAIFALASPVARAGAGGKESWGPALVQRLVEAGRFGAARTVWQRIYRLPEASVAAPLFNPGFAASAATAPFNWTLTADSTGAADPRAGALAVDYYGRDNGDLATQLLVLTPGRYQFAFTADGGKADVARLFWTLTCASGGKQVLMNAAVPIAAGARRAGAAFAVPAGCPAQTLTLRGEAGEFPSPVNVTIGGLALRRIDGARP